MFETVPGATANQPNIFRRGVPIDDEVIIRAVFVLADTRLQQRRVLQPRKSEAKVLADRLEPVGAHRAVARGGIEFGSARIIRNLEAAPFISGNAVNESLAMIGPYRQLGLREAIVTGGRAEEKHVLLGHAEAIANGPRKKFAQPRSASEDVLIGAELRTIRKRQTIPLSAIKITRQHGSLFVLAAFREKSIQHCLTRHPRREKTTLGFVDSPAHAFQINLWPAFLQFPHGKLFVWNARLSQHGQGTAFEWIIAGSRHP